MAASSSSRPKKSIEFCAIETAVNVHGRIQHAARERVAPEEVENFSKWRDHFIKLANHESFSYPVLKSAILHNPAVAAQLLVAQIGDFPQDQLLSNPAQCTEIVKNVNDALAEFDQSLVTAAYNIRQSADNAAVQNPWVARFQNLATQSRYPSLKQAILATPVDAAELIVTRNNELVALAQEKRTKTPTNGDILQDISYHLQEHANMLATYYDRMTKTTREEEAPKFKALVSSYAKPAQPVAIADKSTFPSLFDQSSNNPYTQEFIVGLQEYYNLVRSTPTQPTNPQQPAPQPVPLTSHATQPIPLSNAPTLLYPQQTQPTLRAMQSAAPAPQSPGPGCGCWG